MKIQKLVGSLTVFILLFFTSSCGEVQKTPGLKEVTNSVKDNCKEDRFFLIENVIRVLIMNPGEFTYLYMTPETGSQILFFTINSRKGYYFFLDAEDKSWVRYWGNPSDAIPQTCDYQEVHLKSLDVIGGGGWKKTNEETITKGFISVLE